MFAAIFAKLVRCDAHAAPRAGELRCAQRRSPPIPRIHLNCDPTGARPFMLIS